MTAQLHVFQKSETLFQHCARDILRLIEEVLREQDFFYFALAGGETPRSLFRELSLHSIDEFPLWKRVRFYFGDERSVPRDHADSNFRMADESLFQPLGISDSSVHRIRGELSNDEALQHYREMLGKIPQENGFPRFDLVLLGIGADGHIASLFPDTPLLEEKEHHIDACFVERLNCWRYSLTLPVLNNARQIMLLVSGIKKADVVRHVVQGIGGAQPLPVEQLSHDKVQWYLDADAASFIDARYEDEAGNE